MGRVTPSLRHSTIAENNGGFGGGVVSRGDGLTLSLVYSSIISATSLGDVQFVDGATNSFQSLGYNLIGDGNAVGDFNQAGDQAGVSNAVLAPLGNHGGPTETMPPTNGSPAIDRGDPTDIPGLGGVPLYDQRGTGFTRVAEGDGVGATRVDIGAVERQGGIAVGLVVDTLVDEDDNNFSAGDLSLREAIRIANASIGSDVISFAASLAGGTITLTRGELPIIDFMSIFGPGAALLTIDASGNDPTPATNNGDGSRVFLIRDGNDGTFLDVNIWGLTLTGGDVEDGGAIDNAENLTVIGSTISGNSAGDDGGGIRHGYGNLTVSSSTISGNSAGDDGGGIQDLHWQCYAERQHD